MVAVKVCADIAASDPLFTPVLLAVLFLDRPDSPRDSRAISQMMKLLKLFLGSRSDTKERDACIFVGFRFIRASSTCVDGVCVNLVQRPDKKIRRNTEFGSPVSCSSALELTQAFLRNHATEPINSASKGDMLLFIRDKLLPRLQLLGFGGQVGWVELSTQFRRLDEWIVNEAARDWAHWRDVTLPALMGFNIVKSLVVIVKRIVFQWQHVSMLDLERNHAIVEVVQFYFRFASLTRMDVFDEPFLGFLSDSIDRNPPRARDGNGWFQVPTDTASLLRVSDDIESLNRPHWGGTSLEDLTRMALLISQWTASSSQALLEGQLISSLCSNLSTLFNTLSRDDSSMAHHIRVGVTFIDFCRPFLPFVDLALGRAALGSILHPDSRGLDFPLEFPWVQVSGRPVPWPVGLAERFPSEQLRAAAVRTLHRTLRNVGWLHSIENSRFKRLVFFRNTGMEARTLGRAMGVAMLHGADLRDWALEPEMARLLHARQRGQAGSTSDVARVVGEHAPSRQTDILEDFFEMTAGIDDVLSPGGHEMFTSAEWMERFGPPETYF